MIEVRGLTKQYGDVLAVDDLSFDVEPGKVTGFLGPNGAGKSTTMRMMLGLDRPTAGEALVNGRPFVAFAEPLREVGALLDPGSVHPGRSGRNHLRVGRAHQRRTRAQGRRGDRAGRARRRRPPPDQELLARHAPAPRDRRRPPRRPARPAVRRADQRARPRRRPLDPRAAAPARRRGPHRPGVQSPDERDAADRRPARRDRPRPADRRRDDAGDPARARPAAGARAHVAGRPLLARLREHGLAVERSDVHELQVEGSTSDGWASSPMPAGSRCTTSPTWSSPSRTPTSS